MTHWARRNLVGAWCPSVSGWGGTLLRDLSGNGNHGTLTNMDPATDWVARSGQVALNFDSSSNYIAIGTGLLKSNIGSVSLWFNSSNVATYQGLFGTRTSDSDEFMILIGDSLIQAGSWVGRRFAAISANVTYHCCLISDGVSWRCFINNVEATGGTGVVNFSTFNAEWQIGIERANRFQNGWIDDVRVYNRVLTENEIKLLSSGRGYGLRPERRRKYYFASGGPAFKPYWVRRQSQVICGGVS